MTRDYFEMTYCVPHIDGTDVIPGKIIFESMDEVRNFIGTCNKKLFVVDVILVKESRTSVLKSIKIG